MSNFNYSIISSTKLYTYICVIKLNPEGDKMNFQSTIQFTIAIMETVLADPNIGTDETRRRFVGAKRNVDETPSCCSV